MVRLHMHDRLRTLASLRALRHERSEGSPFADHTAFLRWADEVGPLLGFSEEIAKDFQASVEAATTVRTWRPEKYVPNVNNAIGAVNRGIALLEHQPTDNSARRDVKPELPTIAAPAKLTLKWLYEYAPWSFYAWLGGALAAAFALGYSSSEILTKRSRPDQNLVSQSAKPGNQTATPTPRLPAESNRSSPNANASTHTASPSPSAALRHSLHIPEDVSRLWVFYQRRGLENQNKQGCSSPMGADPRIDPKEAASRIDEFVDYARRNDVKLIFAALSESRGYVGAAEDMRFDGRRLLANIPHWCDLAARDGYEVPLR